MSGSLVLRFMYDYLQGSRAILFHVERLCVSNAATTRCVLKVQGGDPRNRETYQNICRAASNVGITFFLVFASVAWRGLGFQRNLRNVDRQAILTQGYGCLFFHRERVNVRLAVI